MSVAGLASRAGWHCAGTSSRLSSQQARHVSTMDSASVAHFARLSSQWWDPQGEFGLLHAMNPVRLEFMRGKLREVGEWDESRRLLHAKQQADKTGARRVEMHVDRPWEHGGAWLKDVRALDVGCGGGLLSESLARLGANVIGIDASAANIEMAKIHAAQDERLVASPLQYRHVMAEDLLASEGAGQYDVVCAMEVIEHVKSPAVFLQTLADLVKPGGHLFMSTIARTPASYFLTILMAEHVLRLVTPGTHTHQQYINPDELVRHFETVTPWLQPHSSSSVPASHRPRRVQVETRGTFYVPGLSKWVLAPRNANKTLTEAANYFFWIRKPLKEG